MLYALIAVSVLCIAGWVAFFFYLGYEDELKEELAKEQEKNRQSRWKSVSFVHFLQKHPHLLGQAIATSELWRVDFLDYTLQREVEAAEKRVAQHNQDLDLLAENGIEF